MKITIEQNGVTMTLEAVDLAFDEKIDFIKAALVAAGYHPDTVDDGFSEEFRWSEPKPIFQSPGAFDEA